jgi:hypothetical protein
VGTNALQQNDGGRYNTAIGRNALLENAIGGGNTAVGAFALSGGSASDTIALGINAGRDATSASESIFIGHRGARNDRHVIRIGRRDRQERTFIAGIREQTTGNNNAVPVLIDSAGQLGTISSSRRYKEDIRDMGDATPTLLKLRPVTFRYRQPFADGDKPIQYGLIAEEVAEAMPELAVFDDEGRPQTVKYHLLPSLLLQGFHEQQRVILEQRRVNQTQAEHIAALERRLRLIETRLLADDRRGALL